MADKPEAKTGFEDLPKRSLVIDSVRDHFSGKSFQNTALEIGIKLVDGVNRVAAAIEHDLDNLTSGQCGACGSPVVVFPTNTCGACGRARKDLKDG